MWLTWANGVTAVRALLAAPSAILVLDQRWTAAALLFSLAVLSDLLDGALARRLRQATPLGALADHATDAFYVTLVLAALAQLGHVNWLLPLLVAAAFVQYAADSDALRGRALRASWLGRSNGIAYFALAAVAIYGHALALPWPDRLSLDALAWLLVASTLVSMADRLRVWRPTE
jgi:cardiolipin synthase